MTKEVKKHIEHRIQELTSDIVIAEQMDLPDYAELCEHLQTKLLEELMELSEQMDLVCV